MQWCIVQEPLSLLFGCPTPFVPNNWTPHDPFRDAPSHCPTSVCWHISTTDDDDRPAKRLKCHHQVGNKGDYPILSLYLKLNKFCVCSGSAVRAAASYSRACQHGDQGGEMRRHTCARLEVMLAFQQG